MTGRKLLFQGILTSLIALYGCGGGGGGGSTPPGGGSGPTLDSIIVTSPTSTIAKGTSTPFTATALYSNGTSSDVTFLAAWTSSSTAVSTVSATGLAVSVAQGTITISARYSGKTATAPLTVTDAVLISLSVTPPTPSIPKGLTQQFIATGKYSDNSEQNISSSATWTALSSAIATIDSTGLAKSVAPGATTIAADLSGLSSTAVLTVTDAVLASLELAPSNASVPKGWPQSFTATGTFTDMTTQDLTSSATWGSSNSGVASISAGVATSKIEGSTTISAIHTGKTATALLTVTPAQPVSLSLWPPSASIANGKTQQFTATATLTDSSLIDVTSFPTCTWDTSETAVATIGAAGLASSKAPGTTTISAAYSGLTATAPLTITTASLVSVTILPSSPSIANGLTQQFTATGYFSDSSSQDVTLFSVWSSSDGLVSTITSTGLASSKSVGSATIAATYSGLTATAQLAVTAAAPARIDVTPINPILRLNTTQQFTATKVFTDATTEDMTSVVNWSTSDTGIATITTGGLAAPVSRGTATISASDAGSGLTGTSLLLVRAAVTLPDTGQMQSYTNTYGEDSDYTINPPAYVDNNDGTVSDVHTELMWQQQDDGIAKKWVNAGPYCQSLNLSGHTDWRIPTRRELMTILDMQPLQPKIDLNLFPGTQSAKYWSIDPRDISNALSVNFATGELSLSWTDPDFGDNLFVRCVRGTKLIPSILSNNNDGTIIDYATGLMWQQGESSAMLWDDALNYCEGSMLAGHLDWRLPNAKELESLICPTTGPQPCGTSNPLMNPTINTDYFLGAHSALYWSSTTCTQSVSNAYSVNFSDRLSRCDIGKAVTQNYVRCVRGGY